MNNRWIAILCYGGIFILLCLTSSILPMASFQDGAWYSPDEQSNKLFTKTYAENGQLSYTKDYLVTDSENFLHMRGVITYNEQVVPFNFLGIPILYGTIYRFIGDYTELIYIIFSLLILVYLTKLYNLIFKHKSIICPFVIVTCIPLIFYLNSPYFNIIPAVTFTIVGCYYLTKYINQSSGKHHLILGSMFFGIAIFCQYYFIIFISLLILVLLFIKFSKFNKGFVTDVAIYFIIVGVFFILPVLILNNQYYGHPLQYGYSISYEVYFPQRIETGGASLISLSGLKLAFFPSSINVETIFQNIYYYWIRFMPIFTLLAVLGMVSYVRNKRTTNIFIFAFFLITLYFIIYRGGDPGLWGQAEPDPIVGAAILRYWLPLYVIAILFISYYLERIKSRSMLFTILLLVILLVTSLGIALVTNKDSINHRALMMVDARNYGQIVAEVTEENSIIYCGRSDKKIITYREVATFWGDREFEYDMLVQSMTKVRNLGYPVYLIPEGEFSDIKEINSILLTNGLTLTAQEALNGNLYKLESYDLASEIP